MNLLLNERLGAPILPPLEIPEVVLFVVGEPSFIGVHSVVGVSQTQNSSHATHPQGDSKKGCYFKLIIGCKPSECEGSRDLKVTMNWITKTN